MVFLNQQKASISHNNINESCIYLNSKQTWKLSDFELALSFAELSKQNLKSIYEFKSKNSITPEEEELELSLSNSRTKIDLDLVLKQSPHSIDSYGWAMLLIQLLPSYHSENHDKSIEDIRSTNSSSNIIDNLHENEDYCLEQLENYLNKDPMRRPSLKSALNLSLFDLCKDMSLSESSSSLPNLTNNHLNEDNSLIFDPFKMENLNELEQNTSKLVDYLNNLIRNETELKKLKKKSTNLFLNEKLIDFLLKPIMFFSGKIKTSVFPSVFIPKEEFNKNLNKSDFRNKFFINQFHFLENNQKTDNSDTIDENEKSIFLSPFIDLDKYKAFVLPRILSLFSMRSTQIRLVLLEYFPFYISLINDQDTLKYEILPEVTNLFLN